ncbi:lysophospholipid acyltransferase family protein [Alphaproteobacteria bacterium endosymbiont of Tiliacea citrago]|uniref:lysophospholipid acyltransferase family protein n=1 Tax=Alphaproteobacteria bacterium endosymbiont of Tiliacea citrago TaxID=3077944 RepID=UPI00313D96CD
MDITLALFLSLIDIKISAFLICCFYKKFQFNKRFFIVLILLKIPIISYVFKNISFNILFAFMLCFYGFIGFLAMFFSNYIYAINVHFITKLLATHLLFLCDKLLNLKVKVYGELPKNAIIAPQHQSLLEIIAITVYVEKPIFVFQKNLVFIPFLGHFIKSIGMIPVDRSKFNPEWLNLAIYALKSNQNLVIFPEGTRTKFDEVVPFKMGVFKLARLMNKKIIPVYIDTGLFWPKWCLFKKPGTAIIVFGHPIEPDPILLRKALKKLSKNDQKP